MVNTTQTNIYKVTLLLLLAFCLGHAGKLYATQNDEVDEKKEDMPDTAQDSSPNGADNQTTYKAEAIPNWKADWKIDWSCKSIQSCKAVTTIMGCLQYWQKVTNDIKQLVEVFQYLSASNNYRDIVGAYHHVLDKHLNGRKNKEAFRFINGRISEHITCNFAKCKGYNRNQRDRGNEAVEKDEIEQYGEAAIFIRDTLDTIHAYLVHGSDSGHRYSPSKHKPHKVNKRPKDASSDEGKEDDVATASYTLFDKEMAALQKWQQGIKKKGRNQKKNKFSTEVAIVKQQDAHISLDLLEDHFKDNLTFAPWLQYLHNNACDTDVLLHTVHDNIEDNILSSGFKGDKSIVSAVANFIHQKDSKNNQAAEKNKKTASYGFGVLLIYWDKYKNNENTFPRISPYRFCDLYVAPTYPSFKNELLAKKDISVSKWNQKMYAAKLMLAQSATLRKLTADSDLSPLYGIQKDAGLSIWHMLSIVFYTNFTALCTAFGESLRYLSPSESLKGVKQRNSKWYYLSRYLREAVECFGTRIDDKEVKGDTYYHGVSYLLFTQFSVHWHGPLSTSKQMEVATLFTTSTNNGLLLELKEDDCELPFFNVSLLSCFSSEDERLFIGGMAPIQIATIRLLKNNLNLEQIMHALFVVNSIIRGSETFCYNKALPVDASIFKSLCAPSTTFPTYARQIWNAFRHQQKHITIDMNSMYAYYQPFITLLCASKLKNLLLLDKIVQLYPNVTEIICKKTDCIGGQDRYSRWALDCYSSAILSSKFILGLKDRLSKMPKHTKLIKIVIKTDRHEIGDDCKLYAPQFGTLEWKIGKGCDGKTIVVTKEPYHVMYKDVISKISAMIQGKQPSYNIPPFLDVHIFNKLIFGEKDIPADVQKQWDEFRHQQKRITINMRYMYRYYKAFMPLLCSSDPELKNVLLLDKIAQLFPNATKVICKETDCISIKKNVCKDGIYSAAIVSSNFMLAVKEKLSKMDKHAKLTTVVIKTDKHAIRDDCKQYNKEYYTPSYSKEWRAER